MNIKTAVQYRLFDSKRAIMILYTTILSILLLTFLLASLAMQNYGLHDLSSLEIATMVFLFVIGLNSFREVFRMFVQNGISRKTMFFSQVIFTFILSVGMAFIDKWAVFLGSLSKKVNVNFTCTGFFELLYGQRYAGYTNRIPMHLEGFIFNICNYAALMMLGYFITILYYRMNKGQKVTVSVGVPVFLIVVLPILDSILFQRAVGKMISSIWRVAFGFSNGYNPYFGMVTGLFATAVFGGLSWLMIRKTSVKDD